MVIYNNIFFIYRSSFILEILEKEQQRKSFEMIESTSFMAEAKFVVKKKRV